MVHETLFDRLSRRALYEKDTGGQTGREQTPGNSGDSEPELLLEREARPPVTREPTRTPRPNNDPPPREPEVTEEPDRVQAEDSSFSSHSAWDNQETSPVLTEEPIWGQTGEMTTQSAWEAPVAGPALTEKSGVLIIVLLAVVAVLLVVQIVLTGALLKRFPGRKKEKLIKTRNL